MKVHKPGTDCHVEFSIFANGEVCPEYVLPDADDDSSASICLIAIPDDAVITVHGTFSGSVLYGRVDVLADGAFVADRIIEDNGSKEGVLKYWQNRKVDVKTFLHVPDLKDHKPRLRPKVVEGRLVAKRLSNQDLAGPLCGDGEEATGIGVGSLTLVVSLNQEVFDTYGVEGEAAYASVTLGEWRDRITDVLDTGIPPEHELKMDVFPDSNPVKDKRATLFWRDTKALRFGSEAWASLVFYYRSQAAIDAAGCVPLTGSKALQVDGGLFMRASEQELMAAERAKKTPSPVLPPAPTLGTKRSMGLGQALRLPDSQRARDSPGFQRAGSNHESDRDSLFGSADEAMPKTDSEQKARDKMTNNNADLENTPTTKRSSLVPKRDDAASPFQTAEHRVSFSNPLITGPTKDLQGTDSSFADLDNGFQFDDVATPSSSAFKSQISTDRATVGTSASPTVQQPINPLDPIKSSHRPPSHKRPASHLDLDTPTRASLSKTASSSPSPAKRLRSDEIQQRKARLEAELKAKRERKAAIQKKALDEENHRREQQRLWAEEDAKRRAEEEEQRRAAEEEEEERRKAAEEEEEARKADELLIAEMEALERENEMEDEEFERAVEESEKQRAEWEEVVRAREMEDGV
jgi:hypothetical protein